VGLRIRDLESRVLGLNSFVLGSGVVELTLVGLRFSEMLDLGSHLVLSDDCLGLRPRV
jgi:hypothetical protein